MISAITKQEDKDRFKRCVGSLGLSMRQNVLDSFLMLLHLPIRTWADEEASGDEDKGDWYGF
jgi:hypothetical protein